MAGELLANPLIEAYAIESIAGASSTTSVPPVSPGEPQA
jgi:hypothetical protein